MLLEKLKLSKPLIRSMTDAGFMSALEVQGRTLSRIIGAQDLIVSAPEGSGKTTAYIMGILMRIKYGVEEAPRVLVLVPDKERVLNVIENLNLLNKNQTIRVVGLYADQGIETQMNALADGADIVVATPDRARAIYLKLGLNLNKIFMFIVDDAELIIKKGLQLPVNELARSIARCQHLVFTEVIHDKLHQMIDIFMNFPEVIEIESNSGTTLDIRTQELYLVPDFQTKINLLNLLLSQPGPVNKTLVFVNNRLTAHKLLKGLSTDIIDISAVYNPLFFDQKGFNSIEDFVADTEIKIMIIANEGTGLLNTENIPQIIHLEIPEEKEIYLKQVMRSSEKADDLISILFSTDIELTTIRKIESATGLKIKVVDLPDGLIIYKAKTKIKALEPQKNTGAAFHDKKESNVKDFNYSSREKAKMNRKKKHS